MNTLKWGLIGYGDLAEKRVAAALQNAAASSLASVWGRDFEKTRDFARRHHIDHIHETLAGLLSSDVDAIYVCSPPDSHAEYALAGFGAGKHVLVEKPMASSTAQCHTMVEAAGLNNVTLGVAYYRRALPKMVKIKELIDDGLLGTPTWVNIAAHGWYAPAPDDPKHWRVEKNRSIGGAIADIGVHRLDLLDYWMGKSKLLFSHQQHLVHDYEVEDGACATLELQNGAPVHVYFAWNSKTGMDRFEIVGSHAKIVADPLDGPSLTVISDSGREEFDIAPPKNVHLPLVEDFVKAVHENRAPLCDGATGVRTAQLLEQIIG